MIIHRLRTTTAAASLSLALFVTSFSAVAQDDQSATEPDLDPADKQTTLDRWWASLSERYLDTTDDLDQRLDRFLGKERAAAEQNLSFLRVRLDYEYIEEFGDDFKPRVTAKLRFRKNDRASLKIGADDDGVFGPEGGDGGVISGNSFDESDDATTALALGYDVIRSDKNKLDFSIGVRRREGEYQPYGRARYAFRHTLGENWVWSFRNSLYSFSESGWENTAYVEFNRAFGQRNQLYTRIGLAARYRDTDPGYYIADRFSLYHILDPKTLIAYELLGYFQTEEDPITGERRDGTELWFRYRKNFYRPWLFGEIRPMVGWPVERDFDTTWGILTRLEVLFGKQSSFRDAIKQID